MPDHEEVSRPARSPTHHEATRAGHQQERPYWEEYFDLLQVKDAHARTHCRDANGTEPWAFCDCDCTRKLEQRLEMIGAHFLESLKKGTSGGD